MIYRWFRQFELKRGEFVSNPVGFAEDSGMARRFAGPEWLVPKCDVCGRRWSKSMCSLKCRRPTRPA